MDDLREKVIRGLYKLISVSEIDHRMVDGYATEDLCKDALTLLKAQEPIVPKIMKTAIPVSKTAVRLVETYWCGVCGEALERSNNYCRKCGQEVKWG